MGACLSLSGRYARFGRQAARGLDVWRLLDGAADLIVEDDRSDPQTLEGALPRVAARCDVLLGPYSTKLTREAGRLAAGSAREWLWEAALALDIQTLFGGFRIRPGDGVQVGHHTVLVRWTAGGLVPVRAGRPGAAPA